MGEDGADVEVATPLDVVVSSALVASGSESSGSEADGAGVVDEGESRAGVVVG
jgi:hypothetical protein